MSYVYHVCVMYLSDMGVIFMSYVHCIYVTCLSDVGIISHEILYVRVMYTISV